MVAEYALERCIKPLQDCRLGPWEEMAPAFLAIKTICPHYPTISCIFCSVWQLDCGWYPDDKLTVTENLEEGVLYSGDKLGTAVGDDILLLEECFDLLKAMGSTFR